MLYYKLLNNQGVRTMKLQRKKQFMLVSCVVDFPCVDKDPQYTINRYNAKQHAA